MSIVVKSCFYNKGVYTQKSGTSVTFGEKASVYAGFGGHGKVKKA